ncbi:hypothetical protein BASA60_007460 [Batrachochytrium salamandrivorans]|nr:hypothetical protein BASA60_007460 [Batrachochytrium salamandrivorans]
MFHWISGVPYSINQNEYDGLTLWEQIDGGAQFTPTKKYLTAVPIILFLLSTHYTHYDCSYIYGQFNIVGHSIGSKVALHAPGPTFWCQRNHSRRVVISLLSPLFLPCEHTEHY